MKTFLISEVNRIETVDLLNDSFKLLKLLNDFILLNIPQTERRFYEENAAKVNTVTNRIYHKITMLNQAQESSADGSFPKHLETLAIQHGKVYGMAEGLYKYRTGESIHINNDTELSKAMAALEKR